jgi:DNA (cytosine-5)-methyltransferase 1
MGLDLGLEKAGFKVRVTVECNKWAVETIKRNRPGLARIDEEIEGVKTRRILEKAKLKPGGDFIVVGGPACQSFSTAGQRGSVSDPRGDLFKAFLRVVKQARPRFFVMENVRGILSAAIRHRPLAKRGPGNPRLSEDEELGSALKYIVKELKKTGYYVTFDVLNAADFGTPQTRERVIFIGSRDYEAISMPSPTHAKEPINGQARWATLQNALEGLDVEKHDYHELTPSKKKYLKRVPAGGNWRNLSRRLQKKALGKAFVSWGGRVGFFRRLAWGRPAPALTTNPDGKATMLCHPDEDRPLSVQEYAALQQFPKRWKFAGSTTQKYVQIGNAVPLGLGEAIGKAILAARGKPLRLKRKKGIVVCARKELLDSLAQCPRTRLNPPRMRVIKESSAIATWRDGRGVRRKDILELIASPDAVSDEGK